MTEINEPINVWVLFKKGAIVPLAFLWHDRRIKVDKINLTHTSKEGSLLFYHFSISSEGNFYRLRLDLKSLKWILEMVEEN